MCTEFAMTRLRTWLVLFTLAGGAIACSAAPTAPMLTPTPAPTLIPPATLKILRVGLTRYPDVLDPQRAPLGSEAHVLRLVYEGLTTFDAHGNIGAGSADKWTLTPDGLQLTFHLRDGLRRADGRAITARDFEAALKRALDPRLTHRTDSTLLYDIKGAEQVDQLDPLKTKPEDIEKALNNLGIRAADPQNLVITFKQPVGYWHTVAATLAFFPTDQQAAARDPDNWWSQPSAHTGNGAFRFHTIEPNKRIVLTPNPNYWRGKPTLDRLELIYFPGGKGLLEAYQNGKIDIAANLSADDLTVINADATLARELVRAPLAIVYAIAFNRTRKPFDDKNVRVAFAQAFDRASWVRQVFRGLGVPYTRWLPPGVPGAQADKPGVAAYDPRAAVLTLVNHGYAAKDSTAENPKVDCAKLGEIKLAYLTSPTNQLRYEFLAANFTRVFNCPITLEPTNQLNKSAAPISPQGFIYTYPHPREGLSFWKCGSPFAAPFGYCNKELDALLTRADQEREPQKSLALYQQAEALVLNDVPAAFAHHAENLALIQSYVLGVREHLSAFDTEWVGEGGPVWTYAVDLTRVPAHYPRQ